MDLRRERAIKLVLTMPESMSLERRQLLGAYGAEIVLTSAEGQMEGAIARAREIVKERNAFMPGQFDNPANPDIHARTTGHEILSALGGAHHQCVSWPGVGTGGTVSGVGPGAPEAASGSVRVVAVEPDACATISRGERGPTKIQGLAAGFVPKNFDRGAVSEIRTVTDRDAWDTKVRLAKQGRSARGDQRRRERLHRARDRERAPAGQPCRHDAVRHGRAVFQPSRSTSREGARRRNRWARVPRGDRSRTPRHRAGYR